MKTIEIDVVSIGSYTLELDIRFTIVLDNVFYIPSFRRNLVSIQLLDRSGYYFHFGNKKANIIYDSKVVGSCSLIDGLYRLPLSIDSHDLSLNIEKGVAKRPLIREKSRLLWHKRLGHISKERIDRLIKAEILPSLEHDDLDTCIDCVRGKLTKTRKKGANHSQNLLEIIHTDISGPYPTTLCGNRYFITFIDDFSRYGYVYLIKEKPEALDVFKIYRTEVEKQL